MALAEQWRIWWLEMQRVDDESGQYEQEDINAGAQDAIDQNTNTRQG